MVTVVPISFDWGFLWFLFKPRSTLVKQTYYKDVSVMTTPLCFYWRVVGRYSIVKVTSNVSFYQTVRYNLS